jgi:hypothetical protein
MLKSMFLWSIGCLGERFYLLHFAENGAKFHPGMIKFDLSEITGVAFPDMVRQYNYRGPVCPTVQQSDRNIEQMKRLTAELSIGFRPIAQLWDENDLWGEDGWGVRRSSFVVRSFQVPHRGI